MKCRDCISVELVGETHTDVYHWAASHTRGSGTLVVDGFDSEGCADAAIYAPGRWVVARIVKWKNCAVCRDED